MSDEAFMEIIKRAWEELKIKRIGKFDRADFDKIWFDGATTLKRLILKELKEKK